MSFILLFVLIAQLNVRGYANCTNECLCSMIDCPAVVCQFGFDIYILSSS